MELHADQAGALQHVYNEPSGEVQEDAMELQVAAEAKPGECPFTDQAHFNAEMKATPDYKAFIRAPWGKEAKKLGRKIMLTFHPDKFKLGFPGCPVSYADQFAKEFNPEWSKRSERIGGTNTGE
jgi:hypothetical protein